MNMNALRRATLIGTVLQVAMVVAGHYVPFIALHVFMFGGLAISLLAGVIYGRSSAGPAGAAIGGLLAGAICAFVGILISVELRDTPAPILLFGTSGSAVAGLIGGVVGKVLFKRA